MKCYVVSLSVLISLWQLPMASHWVLHGMIATDYIKCFFLADSLAYTQFNCEKEQEKVLSAFRFIVFYFLWCMQVWNFGLSWVYKKHFRVNGGYVRSIRLCDLLKSLSVNKNTSIQSKTDTIFFSIFFLFLIWLHLTLSPILHLYPILRYDKHQFIHI